MEKPEVVEWPRATYDVVTRGGRVPKGEQGVIWKDGVFYRIIAQLPGNRVKVTLTRGKCTC